MKNILITGSSGFIGNYTAKYLLEKKYNVFCISSKNTGIVKKSNFLKKTYNKEKLKEFIFKNKINYVLMSHGSIDHNSEFDKIFKDHFTFTKLVTESLNHKTFKKLIFLSSGDEYGFPEKLPIKESYLCKPISNYALVKNISTNYLLNYFNDTQFSVIILRLFLIHGKNQKNDRLIPMIKNTIKKNKVFYANSINQKKDFAHISELSKCLLNILTYKDKVQDIFNFGSGYAISIKNVIKEIEYTVGKKLNLEINTNKKIKNSFSFYPNINKIKKKFKIDNATKFKIALKNDDQ